MDINKKKEFLINILYISVIGLICFLVFKYLIQWMFPFIISFALVTFLQPLIKRISQKTRHKVNSRLVSLLTTIIALFILLCLCILLVSSLISSIPNALSFLTTLSNTYVPSVIDTIFVSFNKLENSGVLGNYLNKINLEELMTTEITSAISSLSTTIISWTGTKLVNIPTVIVSVIITIISALYTSIHYQTVVDYISSFIPENKKSTIFSFIKEMLQKGLKVLKAYALIIGLTFAELLLGFTILQINNSWLLAFLIALVDILPILGVGTILIPWFIIAFILGEVKYGIGILVIYLVITFVRQLIEPKLVSEQIGLNPLATLVAMFVGLKSVGIIGMFLFPCILVIVKEYITKKKGQA